MKYCVELTDVCQMNGLLVQPKNECAEGECMNDERKSDDAENGLPDSVRATLNNRYGPVSSVPSEIDHAILADARRHLEQHGPATLRPAGRRRVSAWQWTAIASTVAAACVVLFALKPPQPNVDILDAFAMARQLRDGRGEARDFNLDGRFDKFDIDVVALEAVKL